MKKRVFSVLIMTLAFLLLLTACGGDKATNGNITEGNITNGNASADEDITQSITKPDISNSDTFGKFKTVDINGKAVDHTALMGKKVTMVNVWATFCTPCISEMPDLEKISKDYADKDFQIIGMVLDVSEYADGNYDETLLNEAKSVISQTGVTYLNLLTSKDLLNNELGQIYSVPTTYFLDENGNLLSESYVGSRSYNDWAQIIDGYLAR